MYGTFREVFVPARRIPLPAKEKETTLFFSFSPPFFGDSSTFRLDERKTHDQMSKKKREDY